MYQKVNFSDFTDAFRNSQYKHNFTYNGLRALYDYLIELEEGEEEIELDIVAIASDFAEYPNLKTAKDDWDEPIVAAKFEDGIIVWQNG